jgi:stage II sporulation protein D
MCRVMLMLGLVWASVGARPAHAVETVRIAIDSGVTTARITGRGLSYGPDEEGGPFTPLEGERASVARVNEVLAIEGVASGEPAFRFRAEGPISVGAVVVSGEVVVRPLKAGVQAINVLPLEEYLVGVLGSEMPRSFPEAALRAQAVAARTYALHKKLEGYGKAVHLGSSVLSQVYGGLKAHDPRTRAAVEATRGLVLTYELQPIEAYFHASCGGRTEAGLEALGRDLPYLAPVDCPCAKAFRGQWAVTLPPSEVAAVSGRAGPGLSVVSRSATGRARRIRVADRVVDGAWFRQRVGYERVKSLSFQVEPAGEGRYTLSGRGFGHGAGMCQWGAKAHADQGWDFERILEHYYPGAELQRLY